MKRISLLILFLPCILHSESAGSPMLDTVEFFPPYPLPTESIQVTVSGLWGDACVPNKIRVNVLGDVIYIDAFADYPPGTVCAYVITPWGLMTSFGPLPAGAYAVFAQAGDRGYEPFGFLTVGRLPVVYVCEIETVGSVLIQSGGFAGVHKEYAIDGRFRFVHDPANNHAWFTRVEIVASPQGLLPTTDLDKLLNLSGLESTSVTADGATFTGRTSDGAEVSLEAAVSGGMIHLSGSAIPPCCDRYMYEFCANGLIIEYPVCTGCPLMDFNKDCQVNLIDLNLFLSEWMQCNLVPAGSCH